MMLSPKLDAHSDHVAIDYEGHSVIWFCIPLVFEHPQHSTSWEAVPCLADTRL